MTLSPESDRERAEEEAADWLIALTEEPENEALRARFDAWFAASEQNAEVWARTCRAYGMVGQAAPRHRDQWGSPVVSRGAPPMRTVRRPVRRAALGIATVALAACLAFFVAPGALVRMQADVVTATAETHEVALDDGSRVRLAPESAVEVAYSDVRRQVRLIKGQAFFSVARNPDRPFRVVAGGTTATVLGTAFDVRLDPDGARIAVREGRVRVEDASTAPPTRAELAPGEWLRATWNGAALRGRTPTDEVAAWLGGELVARDRPAGEIVDALRPYFHGAIVVQSRRFADLRVSGIYRLQNPAATLGDMAASHGAVMRRVSPWLLVVTDW